MIRELTLTGMGITPFSHRGVTQTLEPIDPATNQRRTMNGALVDLSLAAFRKYQSTISCEDMNAPALDGVMPGKVLTVGCIVELAYAGSLPMTLNTRPAVSGSPRESGGFVFYRPSLTMQVTGFSQERDEWGGVTSWQLDLEEA